MTTHKCSDCDGRIRCLKEYGITYCGMCIGFPRRCWKCEGRRVRDDINAMRTEMLALDTLPTPAQPYHDGSTEGP